ncbi:MAG: DUF29 domain-containing protein [Hydrococcus sp. Prado102]|jgi:hypothetical protein|nr:DUF29 domain-containing protein [Hydrococcus sp. Prado102]
MHASLYEKDYYLWLKETIQLLQNDKLLELDRQNLIEELEEMARSQKKTVKSNLTIILWHLLKYKYQPEKRTNSWKLTIFEHRDRLAEDFVDSPSLKPFFLEVFNDCYSKARQKAAIETELPIEIFPVECPFTPEETLNPEYLPD